MGVDDLDELSSVIKSYFDLKPIGESFYGQLAGIVSFDKKKSEEGIGYSLLRGLGKHSPGKVVNNTDLIESFGYYNGIIQQ